MSIVFVNQAWVKFAEDNDGSAESVSTGVNYLEVCDKAAESGDDVAKMFADGLRSVIAGAASTFELEYACHTPHKERWFIGAASRITGGDLARVIVSHQDISERKQAEDELRKSEERRRLAVKAARVGLWEVDLVSDRVWWDEGYDRLFGSRPAETSESWDWWAERIHPEDRERVRESLDSALKGDAENWRCNYRFRLADSSYGHLQDRATIKRSPAGEAVRIVGAMLDVTELTAAKAEVQEQERYHRSLIHSLHEDILVIDRDYRITDVNNTTLQTLGLTRDKVIGRFCYEVSHGLDAPCHARGEDCGLRRVFETGETCSLHHEHLDAGGNRVHIDILTSPVKRDDGTISHVIEAVRDVTDLFEAQQALAESEEKFRIIFENKGTATGIVGVDGVIRECNDSFAELVGYHRSDLIDISKWSDFVVKEDLARLQQYFRQRFEQGNAAPTHYECGIVHRNGEVRTVVVTVAMNGKDRIVSLLDITDRKQAERLLSESEERYRNLFNSVPVGIYRSTPEGRFLDGNPAIMEILGYPDQETLLTTDIRELYLDQSVRERELASIELDGSVSNYQLQLRRHDGAVIWVQDSSNVVRDSSGQTIHYYGRLEDISERMQAENRLRESEAGMKKAQEIARLGSWSLDLRDGQINWSDEMYRIYGFEKGTLPTMATVRERIVPEDLPVYDQAFQDLEKGIVPESIEYRLQHPNGQIRHLISRAEKITDEAGAMTRLIGTAQDITERKQMEEALEKRLVALTSPLDDPEGITFEELFNLADIQRLQDEFAEATGVASIITWTDGTPITKPSNFCRLCSQIIRQTEKGLINCYKSDAELGSPNLEGPVIQPCLSGGLWDAGASISVDGRHIANWLIGQVRDETQTDEKMRAYAREIGADEDAVSEAFNEVPAMSREQFGTVSQALFTLANQLSDVAYQNVQQARFITERRKAEEELEKHRLHLEELVEQRTQELQEEMDQQKRLLNLMAGREVRMAELKKVIKKLRGQLDDAGIAPIANDPLLEPDFDL